MDGFWMHGELLLVVRPLCEALIDQGRVIGGDPVGHACLADAQETVWLEGLSWRVCASCAALVRVGSNRVTLPLWRARLGDGVRHVGGDRDENATSVECIHPRTSRNLEGTER